MNTQTLEEFKQRLAQTIFWCATRADRSHPKTCLRTPSLRPRLLEKTRLDQVNGVVFARELSGGEAIRNAQIPNALGGGRLMVYFPDGDLACGAAEVETEGFFNVNNVPAWDTWVSYWEEQEPQASSCENEYLVAWIPPGLVKLVNEGISVNPEVCIQWLSDTSVELARLLRAEKLLV